MEDFIIYKITNLAQLKDPVDVGGKRGFFYIANKYLVITSSELVSDMGLEEVSYKNDSEVRQDILGYFRLNRSSSDSKRNLHKLLSIVSTEELFDNLKNDALVFAEEQRHFFESEFPNKNFFNIYRLLISQIIVSDINNNKEPSPEFIKILAIEADLKAVTAVDIAKEKLKMLFLLGEVENNIEDFILATSQKLEPFLLSSDNEIDRGIKMKLVFNEAKNKLQKDIEPFIKQYKILM